MRDTFAGIAPHQDVGYRINSNGRQQGFSPPLRIGDAFVARLGDSYHFIVRPAYTVYNCLTFAHIRQIRWAVELIGVETDYIYQVVTGIAFQILCRI